MRHTTVKDWMKNLVVFVDPDTTVYEALSIMRHRYATSLIVDKTPENPEYGIVTSINICDKIVAQGNNPTKTKVKDIMASPVITVPSSMVITECAAMMKEHRIHHLPVADEKGQIIGMIAAMDLLLVAEAMGTDFKDRSLH
jgi:signal-transduction protein with cAMP-binding, CBS, and nucleotidyltransferase domain